MSFTDLITTSHEYLSCFDYDHYPDCFRRFESDCAPLFDGLDAENLSISAFALIRDLESARGQLPRRKQKDAAFLDKQVLALFLSPAAERHSETARAFAAELQRIWCLTYPKNTYLTSDYDSILNGFDANLLGLPLRKSSLRSRRNG